MQRMGLVIGIRPERIAEYKRLHAECWPEIRAGLGEANLRNVAIFLREPENLLFLYWEYHGTDYAADMARMAAQDVTQRWWALCGPCQAPLPSRAEGEWWAPMELVFVQA